MTQPVDPLAPAIGACVDCNAIWLVTPRSANCLTCGRPPGFTLPFSPAEQVAATPESEPVFAPEEPPDEEGPMPPPSCLPEELLAEEPAPPAQDEEAEEGSDLINAIAEYLEGGEPTPEWVLADLLGLGADPEAAATAVGRLAAVRELIAQLAQPQEPQPSAPEEEEDRTTVPSP